MKATLGKNAFVLRIREWGNAQIRESASNPLSDFRGTERDRFRIEPIVVGA